MANYLDEIEDFKTIVIVPLAILSFVIFVSLFSLAVQPKNAEKLTFKVPAVPLLPALSVFFNVYLMMKLSVDTWIRFVIWVSVGLIIYIFYGVKNSSENVLAQETYVTNDNSDTDCSVQSYGSVKN